ncbi:hypothetical protein FGADI_9139 [Fusarium gaditjirri]|uniref:Aminoglycoside phosphotransferase domain-containing protein n=1 Tax=Fusarium gaditjirri TaxID=282569 RepID=A0A8H4T0K5_9HYPO|nr:hypothetical protein FGADI_9139 [Fusarium gaditjirri]
MAPKTASSDGLGGGMGSPESFATLQLEDKKPVQFANHLRAVFPQWAGPDIVQNLLDIDGICEFPDRWHYDELREHSGDEFDNSEVDQDDEDDEGRRDGPDTNVRIPSGIYWREKIRFSAKAIRFPKRIPDLEFLAFVERTYGRRFIPGHWNAGMVGMLHAYTMDNVHGISAYLSREQLRANGRRLLNTTIQDLASFFASAWRNTPPSMPIPDRGELYASYEPQLQQLHEGLPVRFLAMLKRLLKQLPELFAEDWPLVPNTDLLENNIHVNPKTGSITGICDWKDAAVGPFGTSIKGLECLLGERTMKGWRWLPNQMNLRGQFWQAFYAAMGSRTTELKQRVDTARLVGIFPDAWSSLDGC